MSILLEEPIPPPWKEADADDRARARRVPYGYGPTGRRVDADTEEAFSERDEEFHPALLKVRCPGCNRTCAPLLSSRTRLLGSGWTWRGISHQEPYSEWLCVCPGCRCDYVLTMYTPQ